MSLVLEDITDLLAGERDPVTVCELPFFVAELLGLRNPNVYLSAYSLHHILDDHPEVTQYDLLRLPFVVRRGLLVREREKSNILIANYQDDESSRRWCAALKMARPDKEIYVQTFHRAHQRQTRAHLKRGIILKKHD